MKLTRRKLTVALAAIPAAAASAQAQADATRRATVEEDLTAARENIRNNVEQMKRFKLPMATEPAFQFKP